MKYVNSCCKKVDGYMQDELGHWRKTGRIGNQLVRSERGAENMAMSRALRKAVTNGYIDPVTNLTFRG